MDRQVVVFTDLDGTLIDSDSYSPDEATPAIEKLRAKGIPIVFCSSKTRTEQEFYRECLAIDDPFIVEDGGAIFSETGYFSFPYDYTKRLDDYEVIELGATYAEIRGSLNSVQSELNLKIVGYGDLDTSAVASLTGLSGEQASRAQQREYQETVVSTFSRGQLERLDRALGKRGLVRSQGGRFMGIGGETDKGIAASVLSTMFRKKYGEIVTVGIGDSFNDIPLFLSVDVPVLVQQPDATWAPIAIDSLHRVPEIGPNGWKSFVDQWLV